MSCAVPCSTFQSDPEPEGWTGQESSKCSGTPEAVTKAWGSRFLDRCELGFMALQGKETVPPILSHGGIELTHHGGTEKEPAVACSLCLHGSVANCWKVYIDVHQYEFYRGDAEARRETLAFGLNEKLYEGN